MDPNIDKISNQNKFGNCPHCGVSWQGEPIPDKYFDPELNGNWLPYGDLAPEDRFYGRVIGVELAYDHPKHYDGVSYWLCPDCHSYFDRWTGERVTETDAEGNPVL